MEQEIKYMFKIILIGDSGVGKTSLMNRYTDNVFEHGNASTIGLDFKIKTIGIGDAKLKLQIWDTAGQERFRAMVSYYYRGANGILVVFDLTNRDSFVHLKDWFEELEKKDVLKTTELRILGNKVDEKENLKVNKEEVLQFLGEYKIPASSYYEVSAKDDICVEDSFVELSKRLIDKCGAANIKQLKKTMVRLEEAHNKCC